MKTGDKLSSHLQHGERHLGDVSSIEIITPCVTRVLGENPGPFTLQGTNTYLVGTGSSKLLIDAGSGEEYEELYLKNLKIAMLQIGCKTLEGIIVTHWHHDHIGGVKSVQKMMKSEFNQKKEIPVFKYMPDLSHVDFKRDAGFTHHHEQKTEDFIPKEKIVEVTHLQKITCQGATLTALFTPGHAHDHICLYLSEEKALFSGDNVLGTGTGVFDNLTTYIESLRQMDALKPERIYPGHGPIVLGDDAKTKIQEYLQHRLLRVEQVKGVLNQSSGENNGLGVTSAEITKAIYTEIPMELFIPAQWNTEKILTHLCDIGECQKTEDEEASYWRLTSNL